MATARCVATMAPAAAAADGLHLATCAYQQTFLPDDKGAAHCTPADLDASIADCSAHKQPAWGCFDARYTMTKQSSKPLAFSHLLAWYELHYVFHGEDAAK
jgi:hypothetical protein